MRKFLKPFSFLPALLLMYMIYSFSGQDGEASSALSYKVSYTIVKTADRVLDAGLEDWEMQSLATRFHGVTRKLAHMTEYFALAIAVSFPLYVYGLHGILLMLTAGIICVGFACGDEYHQSFVAGRSPAVRDVLIDSFGVFWGIVLVRIIGWTGRKTIFRPVKKKKRKGDSYYESPGRGRNDDFYEPPYYDDPPLYREHSYTEPHNSHRERYASSAPHGSGRSGYRSPGSHGGRQGGYGSQTPYDDRQNGYEPRPSYDDRYNGYDPQARYDDRQDDYGPTPHYEDRQSGYGSQTSYGDRQGRYSSQVSYEDRQGGYGSQPQPPYDDRYSGYDPQAHYEGRQSGYDPQARYEGRQSGYGPQAHYEDRSDASLEFYDDGFYEEPAPETPHARTDPYTDGQQRTTAASENRYHRQSYPSYHDAGYTHQEVKEAHVSDKLAEDMSFKKLMHDIKEQRKDEKKHRT